MGAAFHKGELWVNVAGSAWTIDLVTAAKQAKFALPAHTQDFASDGTNLWCLPGGWTKGDAITVVSPDDGVDEGPPQIGDVTIDDITFDVPPASPYL